mmetsp:Transcript_16656/g.2719  ORF Transcript_16656/g.2719 Transcript_16656/m.2719 type:complete len:82 (+) Transcript_16656:133-378(+)
MGICWFVGLATHIYATRTSNLAFRAPATLIMSAVPLIMTLKLKGEKQFSGWPYNLTVEDRLKYYPITRRAFERALAELEEE